MTAENTVQAAPERSEKPEKLLAARALEDEIINMQLQLERAEIIMQDITEDYFGTYDPRKPDDRFCMAVDYSRHSIKSDIVTDYLFNLRKALESLEAQAQESNPRK